MASNTRNHPKVDVPHLDDLIDCFECELDEGDGKHDIVSWEVVTRVHFDVCCSGSAQNFDQDWDVLWWTCECGHQTYP